MPPTPPATITVMTARAEPSNPRGVPIFSARILPELPPRLAAGLVEYTAEQLLDAIRDVNPHVDLQTITWWCQTRDL